MANDPTILITGATGNQGGAVARALTQLLESIDRELEARQAPDRPVVK